MVIFKKFLLIGLCLIAFLVAAGVSFFTYITIPKYDRVYIKNGDFFNFNHLNKIYDMSYEQQRKAGNYPAEVHRLKKGESVILIYRYFHEPDIMIFDDEIYRKLTISLDNNLIKKGKIILPNPGVRAVYSDGGAAWPEAGCHGYASKGSVEILGIDEELTVRIDLGFSFDQFGEANSAYCDAKTFNSTETFKLIEFSELSPYMGAKAEYPYEATYR
ncbi:MAG: hypothetical protein HYV97_02715 [Bdellovibrio sp.]|nr:hypothetical protein [Bdellovibrio sp.]